MTRARSPVIVMAEMATSHTSVLRDVPDVMSSNDTSITSRSTSRLSATCCTSSMSKPVG